MEMDTDKQLIKETNGKKSRTVIDLGRLLAAEKDPYNGKVRT